MRVFLFLLVFTCFNGHLFGQITVSKVVQKSAIAHSDSNKLYLVDFWATWCKPCIHAKKYLTSLQEQFPKEFYVFSLSNENNVTVQNFLERNPSKLAIGLDFQNTTFSKFGIHVLPQTILFNAKGEMLWKGHPAGLKNTDIANYLNQENQRVSIDNFLIQRKEADLSSLDYMPVNNIEINEIPPSSYLDVQDSEDFVKIKGNIKAILAYLGKTYRNQISLDNQLDKSYEIYFKKPLQTQSDLTSLVLQQLNLGFEVNKKECEVLYLKMDNPHFWDTTQFNWSEDGSSKVLVGDSDIQADNMSLKELIYYMSTALDIPVRVDQIPENSELLHRLHDWDIHYGFYDLMKSSLKDNYGIEIEKKNAEIDIYHIFQLQGKS